MRSVVDRKVVRRCIPVHLEDILTVPPVACFLYKRSRKLYKKFLLRRSFIETRATVKFGNSPVLLLIIPKTQLHNRPQFLTNTNTAKIS